MTSVQGSLFDEVPGSGSGSDAGDGGTDATSAGDAGARSGVSTEVVAGSSVGAGLPSGVDATTLLAPWRAAGVLHAADVHLATTLARLAGLGGPDGVLEADEAQVVLGAALAARAPRHGHVCLDLETVQRSVPAEVEGDADAVSAEAVEALPWPHDIPAWHTALAQSSLVAESHGAGRPGVEGSGRAGGSSGADGPGESTIASPPAGRGRPLVLDGSRLYLERYRVHEDHVATELCRRAAAGFGAAASSEAAPPGALGPGALRPGGSARSDAGLRIDDLLVGLQASPEQLAAAEAGARGLLSVIVGGPGTGKTTTVAVLLAHLLAADPSIRIALVAPTGKASARMGESIAALADRLRAGAVAGRSAEGDDASWSVVVELADRLAAAEVSTVHRLLGARPDGTFRHHGRNPLAHDVVIVDETSMVSLPLMAHLLDAARPDARLVLVGDPGQLASVEAGSVLGDIAGPAVEAALEGEPAPPGEVSNCVSVLTRSYRFPAGSAVGRFAAAVRAGDADTAVAVLRDAAHREQLEEPSPESDGRHGSEIGSQGSATGTHSSGGSADGVILRWEQSGADTEGGAEAVIQAGLGAARQMRAAALDADAALAIEAMGSLRVLCAHRRGPFGVARWNWQFEERLADGPGSTSGFYVGRPVLVTANDPVSGLSNGDLGVVVATATSPRVAFASGTEVRLVAPARLEAVETVHAMTIHKSQGSEFDEVVVVLPPAESRLATRELLYTAVTRARRAVTLVGGESALRRAVGNRVVRQSGLRDRLWPT